MDKWEMIFRIELHQAHCIVERICSCLACQDTQLSNIGIDKQNTNDTTTFNWIIVLTKDNIVSYYQFTFTGKSTTAILQECSGNLEKAYSIIDSTMKLQNSEIIELVTSEQG